jgi:hypothetical protein
MEKRQMTRHKPNRGVVLLVVLSLLVLFVVVGLTYVVVAGQFRKAAFASAKRQKLAEQPEKLTDLAIYQLIRGTRGSRVPSSFHGQDLLGDLYGNDGVKGVVVGNAALPHAAAAAGGDFTTLRFNFSAIASQPFSRHPQLAQDRNMLLDDYFNGRVLTMLSGPLAGHSTRVVDYYVTPGGGGRWGVTGVDDDGNGAYDDYAERGYPFNPLAAGGDQFLVVIQTFNSDGASTGLPAIGNEFIINGRPFNGTGAGYLDIGNANYKGMGTATYNLDAFAYDRGADGQWGVAGTDDDGNTITDDAVEAGWAGSDDVPINQALAPHYGAYPSSVISPDRGGVDEPYDAADYQNMYLAMISPDATMPIIPSFHRPSLINYWANNPDPTVSGQWSPATNPRWWKEMRRRVIFRPMPWDHPNFTGGNRNLSLTPSDVDWDMANTDGQPGVAGRDDDNNGIVDDWSEIGWPGSDDRLTPAAEVRIFNAMVLNGSYDVDNDGDGRKDSMWMDIGLPIKTGPDGRSYKPLVAVLCVDMDGRLNVNAHGQLAHMPPPPVVTPNPSPYASWAPGADGAPGVQGRDDDGNGNTDDAWEFGWPGSDDLYVVNSASLPIAANPQLQLLFPDNRNPFGVSTSVPLPRGRGEGPAEISLLPGFWGAFKQAQNVMLARYGGGKPGTANGFQDKWSVVHHQGAPIHHFQPWQTLSPMLDRRPDRPIRDFWLPGLDGNWGRAGIDDDQDGTTDEYDESGFPGTDDFHYNTAYGDPSNIRGLGPVGMDLVGNPYHLNQGFRNEYVDNPYEHSPQANSLSDRGSPRYTVHDLEGMQRIHDADGRLLKSRLLDAASSSLRGGEKAAAYRRHLLTTHSSHIPTPSTGITSSRRAMAIGPPAWPMPNGANGNVRSPHVLDLYVEKLLRNGVTSSQLQGQLNKIVPWEIRHGLKFDINRPFGNGLDDNHNDVVDDPQEWLRGEVAFTSYRAPPTFGRIGPVVAPLFGRPAFNHRNGGPSNLDPRSVYARHLYCMMMLLVEDGYRQPFIEQSEETAIRTESQSTYGDDRLLKEITAQRIAQWAVNVVDFRDSDAIMTPFEYDINPFDGWDVDGWISMGPGPDGAWGARGVDDNMNSVVDERAEAGAGDDVDDRLLSPTSTPPRSKVIARQRRVVWGVERPDLMLTEVKSTHSVRTKDSSHDDDMQKTLTDPMPDATMDQYRIPQGSVFIELYCPQNRFAHDPRMPAELYDFDGKLDLHRLAPGQNPAAMMPQLRDRPHPVWQVVIARKTENAGMGEPETPWERLDTAHQLFTTTEFDPNNMRMLYDSTTARQQNLQGRDEDKMEIDRIVWFVKRSLDASLYGNNIFQHFGDWDPKLAPGHYAVVAPRPSTRISNRLTPPTAPADLPPQELKIDVAAMSATFGQFTAVNYDGNPQTPTNVKPILGIVAAMAPRATWQNSSGVIPQYAQDWGIGLSFTEPLASTNKYYDAPDYSHPLGATYPDDYYYDEESAAMGMMPADTLPDVPFDGDDPGAPWRDRPLKNADGDDMLEVDSYEDVRTTFLQRLSNPTIPWNPMPGHPQHTPGFAVNPYLSVDWASTDLTVYNGEDRTNQDPDDTSKQSPGGLEFASRQRGKNGPGNQFQNFFNPVTEDPPTNGKHAGAPASHAFQYELKHTLGFLNNSDPAGTAAAALRFRREGVATPAGTTSRQYMGDPKVLPLPTIWWNNRPYANALELLQVPSSTPSRLFLEFQSNRDLVTPPVEYDNYNEFPTLAKKRRFYQLMNFFSSHSYNPLNNQIRRIAGQPVAGANFYRLFDFVETPSRFVDTEKWLNPIAFSQPASPGADGRWGRAGVDDDRDGQVDDIGEAGWPGSDDLNTAQDGFRPPFNRVSKQRDPGKINLNTIPITNVRGPDGEWGVAGLDDDNNGTVDDAGDFGLARVGGQSLQGISDDLRAGPLEGIMKGFPSLDTARFANKFFMSRRGYHTVPRALVAPFAPLASRGGYGLRGRNNTQDHPLDLDPYYPTRFANPFRPAWATTMLPRPIRTQFARDGLQIVKNQINGTPLRDASNSPFMDDVQGTLLRRDSLTPTRGADGQWGAAGIDDNSDGTVDNEADGGAGDDIYRNEPLFVPDPTTTPVATARWRNQNHNANHRYLGLSRMANLTSTTSNVFSVWVTVGFFEVEPVHRRVGANFEIPESHPDGYRLGRELGADLGNVKRHRGYYVIDRSTPVAYEPGENHNVDRAILLRRFIQ